ncbi:hypothetical protein DPMN_065723 [Dreissena polymorpha]|uniref:Uncharacterized protein n=1 Tax=Dreissena polymorpha TaxID=45954 RepID=A0A9D4BUF1_DREPO|nr:hypothetical protein DPMN_065723 [Dreissena polymorpha]
MLFFGIGKHQLLALQQHVREHGLTPRVHGNRGRKPKHAICYDDVMHVVHFIRYYADERGLPQPADTRGVDNVPTVYLTSDTTKTNLHQKYPTSCTEAGFRVIYITASKEIWRTCLPLIRIAGPRDDVYAKCEKLRRGVMDAVTEEEKLTATDSLRNHILLAQNVIMFDM